ncbi:MAG: IS66 family transposase, partial [Bacteroidales bacterium]|nr:IS66 family transposase [Bacteroidales bacterium]
KNKLLEQKKLIIEKDIKIILEKEKVAALEFRIFGTKSEKWTEEDYKQARLFDEAENNSETPQSQKEKTVEIKSHKRKKKGRKPISSKLPRTEIIHELEGEDKIGPNGREMIYIGKDDVSEEVQYIPAKITVFRHIYKKYVEKSADKSESKNSKQKDSKNKYKSKIRTARRHNKLISKSFVTPSLMANILVSKFEDGLPYYRQEKIFRRLGFEMSRANMSNWQILIYEKLKGFENVFKNELFLKKLLHIDETTIQVLNEKNRKNKTKSYMWVFGNSYKENKPIVWFNYQPTRHSKPPLKFLQNYQGSIMTDGYAGYTETGRSKNIIHAVCWAHVRRKFTDAKKTSNISTKLNNQDVPADVFVYYIEKLYRIEKKGKNLSNTDLVKLRQKYSKPIIDKIKNSLDENKNKVLPNSMLSKAINYALNQWDKLIVFLEHGIIPLDNNLAENAIRPFVIGRKNWLFSGSPQGANASALFYSLIESAKANEHEPFWYLYYLLEKSMSIDTDNEEELEKLSPHNVTKEQINKFRNGIN